MKLSDQVCTLEQAKKLKELGINEFGLFVHYTNKVFTADFGIKPKEQTASWASIGEIKSGGAINYYPAFTVAELGVMLPEESGIKFFGSHYNDHLGCWNCEYRGFKTAEEAEDSDWECIPPLVHEVEGDTEAEARADMLIYLLENKLVTPEEINNRLIDQP